MLFSILNTKKNFFKVKTNLYVIILNCYFKLCSTGRSDFFSCLIPWHASILWHFCSYSPFP